uniref:C-type lectin domain-containing protein n=1 Tax=Plectus sambesii TaxID=2011161 RepID=A0A914VYD9_9BILA
MAGMSSTATCDWIGLHQVGSFELSWAWYDGTPLNYTNWSPNFPQEGHRCAQICHSGSGLQGKWISTNCVDPMSVSCEYPDSNGGISTTARAP